MKLKAMLLRLCVRLFGPPAPTLAQIIAKVVSGTSGLELTKLEKRELAPYPGMFGRVQLSGNSLPCFEYRVFDKPKMEFVEVTARLALPDKITWQAHTLDLGLVIPEPEHQAPLLELLTCLYHYFPLLPPKDPINVV